MLISFKGKRPVLGKGTKIFPNATVLGNVVMGESCSVWPGASVRCDRESDDTETIRIGDRVNIQDCASVHIARGGHSVRIGNDTSIGHGAIVHGCTVGERCLIGMGAILQNDCVIGNDCLIGSGALVSGGTVIPDGHLAFGSPARVIRPLRPEELEELRTAAAHYTDYLPGYPEFEEEKQ